MAFTGTFYFKQTSYGNLMGEFTNNASNDIRVETAFPLEKNNGFEGKYKSIWFDTVSHEGELYIKQNDKKYILTWQELNKTTYAGEGFMVDNILIGFYRY